MSEVRLKIEKFNILKTVAMKFGRTIVDDSLIVPDIKPDIKKVLDVSARSYITDVTPGQDKVHIEGVVKAAVLYMPDGDVIGRVKALDMSREFSETIEAKGTTPDSIVSAESEIDSVDGTVINSRKINVRTAVSLGVKISRFDELEFATGSAGLEPESAPPALVTELLPFLTPPESTAPQQCEDGIQFRKMPLRLADKNFTSDGSMILRGEYSIPSKLNPIGETLCANAQAEPDDVVCTNGSIRLRGNIRVSVLYEDDPGEGKNSVLRTAEFTIPYDEQFDTPKAQDDMECEAEYTVREIYTEVLNNDDGEARNIGAEVVVGVSMNGYMISEPFVITDAYDISGGELEITFAESVPEQLADNSAIQINQKCTAKRKPTDADISGVCGVTVEKTSVDDVRIEDGFVRVKGGLTAKVLCSSADENQPLYPIEITMPFEHSFETGGSIDGKIACDAKVFVNHIGYTISGADSVDLRPLIGISIRLTNGSGIKTISAIERNEPEKAKCRGMQSYILYFVQKGDTLWSIAKRYRTTVDDIISDNNISDPDKIIVGQRIRLSRAE